jgi:AcrR family transcriptional regulator
MPVGAYVHTMDWMPSMYSMDTLFPTQQVRGCHTESMQAENKRSYHHGDLRSALLKAGHQAVRNGGVDSFSLRDVARVVGVSNYAPRRHFENKQALLNAIVIDGFGQLRVELNRASHDKHWPFAARILSLTTAYLQFARENEHLLRLMFSAKHQTDAPEALLRANHDAWEAGPQTILEGQESGEAVQGDPKRLSLVLFAAIEGLFVIYTEQEFGGTSLEALAEEIVLRILGGLERR